ncbi:hypothetical protein GCM10017771_89520 [Streptomyces capitiformicae]|uniref:Uncharacterized protein n=1 Tax=Streptomyces capitiformicae TaxID=2014920 RepID=A0A918ZS39_9ACTN|nr:hypothetical protein GCM10017771_89520 [Streptomyces capitiformicae]
MQALADHLAVGGVEVINTARLRTYRPIPGTAFGKIELDYDNPLVPSGSPGTSWGPRGVRGGERAGC